MKLLLLALLLSMSSKEVASMADKVIKHDGMTISHYLTPIFEGGDGRAYSPEFQRDIGEKTCTICGRLWKEHTREDFCDHWEQSGVPVVLTPEQIEEVKNAIRKNPSLTPEQAEEAIREWLPDSKE